MYNDLSSIDSLEFFELYNAGNSDAKLGGYKVVEGIVYKFPAGTKIPANGFLVIAKDSALVNSVFGITGTHQWVSGGLKNSGEDIEIINTKGDTIVYVDYDDSSPWPVKADGDGYSMVFCDKTKDNNDGANSQLASKYVTTFNGDSIFADPGEGCIASGFFHRPVINDNISIYPNPAHNRLYINTNGKEYSVRIFDISGSMIKSVTINSATSKISIENLKSGLYYIQFTNTKSGVVTGKKLIVE
jgi:hypothetical protein